MLKTKNYPFFQFQGWSERLELQEQYADVREERMDELTDSLVTCMTGEEGRGGEDQDLGKKLYLISLKISSIALNSIPPFFKN